MAKLALEAPHDLVKNPGLKDSGGLSNHFGGAASSNFGAPVIFPLAPVLPRGRIYPKMVPLKANNKRELRVKRQIRFNGNLVSRTVDDELVFLHLEKGEYFTLNPTAKAMWNELKATGNVREAFERLRDKFRVDPKILRRDFEKFVEELKRDGFIKRSPEPNPSSSPETPVGGGNGTGLLNFHQMLLRDSVRMNLYRKAIFETVRKGDVVMDLGCGTGILSFLACKAGASRVYAIEQGAVIELAKELSLKNGFGDSIVFIQGHSKKVSLPEKADVILTETISNFGLEQELISCLIDARRRLLKKTGRMIPQAITLLAALAQAPKIYEGIDWWSKQPGGFDFSPLRPLAINNFYQKVIDPRSLLSPAVEISTTDFRKVSSPHISSNRSLTCVKQGIVHGIAGWFSAELSPHVILSNEPPRKTSCWSHVFFPISEPLAVRPGQKIRVSFSGYDGQAWRWQVSSETKERYEQSTFRGFPLNKELLSTLII